MKTTLLRFSTGLGLLFLFAIANAASPAAPGFLEGRLKIETTGGAQLADENSAKTTPAYADYPLVILSKDGRTEVAQVTVDKEGHYRVVLPPGDYILDVKARDLRRSRTTRHPFKIVSEQTAHVDMNIGPDLRVM